MVKRKEVLRKKIANNSNVTTGSLNHVTLHLPLNSPFDFPQLGESSTQYVMRKEKTFPTFPEDESTSNNQTTAELDQKIQVEPKEQNIKKSKRPILLDFSAYVKNNEKMNVRKHGLKSRSMKHINTQLSGNHLDSSNPVRCKGKSRENKKIKLSALKINIIKERILKTLSHDDAELESLKIDLKKEIAAYIDSVRSGDKRIINNQAKAGNRGIPHSIFTAKFKWYCENIISNELNEAASELIKRLVNLQDRAFDRDPVRARAHKRFVTGLREAKKYLKLQKIKFLLIAPDLETADSSGPLSLYLKEIKLEANMKGVPYGFVLDRRKLGYCSLRKTPVSVFAIMNYEGAEAEYETVMKFLQEARLSFEKQVNEMDEPVTNEVTELFQCMKMEDEM